MAAFTSNRLKAAIYMHYGFRGVAIWLPYGFAMVAIRYRDLACLGKGLAGNVTQGWRCPVNRSVLLPGMTAHRPPRGYPLRR